MPIPNLKVREVDRPEISETFADSMGLAIFDGNTARLELCVHRYDAPRPPGPPTAAKVTAARLVLSPEGVVAVFNFLNNLMPVLVQQGIVKQEPGQPPSPVKPTH